MSHRARRQSLHASTPAISHAASGGFPSEHRRGLLPESYFRWRGGEITRLEAFCDVVFGFALTLLVVSLEVPKTYAEMMTAMRGFLPFAVCFSQLVMIWLAHYRFSRRFGLEDPYTVFLNLVLLFLVLFYVYPLKFVFALVFSQLTGTDFARGVGWHEAAVLMRVYAIGFTAVFSLFALMYAHAYRLRNELELNPVEVLQTKIRVAGERHHGFGRRGLVRAVLSRTRLGQAGGTACSDQFSDSMARLTASGSAGCPRNWVWLKRTPDSTLICPARFSKRRLGICRLTPTTPRAGHRCADPVIIADGVI